MNVYRKILHRLFRIVIGKRGIYCKYGKGNKFNSNSFMHEISEIGKYNYFGKGVMIYNAKIGNYNSVAPSAKIGQLEHDLQCVSTSTHIFGPTHGITTFTGTTNATVIENDVWIGANSVILQGVKIGTGAVIGAGAVVTKDVPPYAVVVGVPAKILKYRFDDNVKSILLSSNWWDNSPNDAVAICSELQRRIV